MEPLEIAAQIKQRAGDNFETGMNCAECVLEAFLYHIPTGLPGECMCLMTGFGGGGALFGDTCGSLVGAMAALGAVYGRRQMPHNFDAAVAELYGNPGLYRVFNRLMNEFKKRFGHTQCRALTLKWQDKDWLSNGHMRFCRNLITAAAGLAAEMAYPKDLQRWGREPFGENVEGLI